MREVAAAAIDPASAATLKRFLLRVGLLALFDLALNRQPVGSFIAMMDVAAIFTGACAVFSGEPAGRGPLNQWDEALALFGVRCLVAAF